MGGIIAGETSIYDGYEKLEDTGEIGSVYKTIQKFNKKIGTDEFEKMLAEEDPAQIKYQLKQVQKMIKKLLDKMS